MALARLSLGRRPAPLLSLLLLLGLASLLLGGKCVPPPIVINEPDTVLEMNSLFSGLNIYAPSTLYVVDTHYLWYSGWQSAADWPNDNIYFRSSLDGLDWSDPITVITPEDVPGIYHVGDPSVAPAWDAVNERITFVMFYTACLDPCTYQSDNEIWSAVSEDGINWSGHRPLVANGMGAAEPSALFALGALGGGGAAWEVYYVERLDAQLVKLARVDIDRNVIDTQVVYRHATGGTEAISGVHVGRFNNRWNLFFNVFYGTPLDRVDIYKTESISRYSFPELGIPQIENQGPDFCATLTPSALPLQDGEYALYFGLVPRQPDGSCNLADRSEAVHVWYWRG